MIHSARPTVSPVANIVFTLFCFARFCLFSAMTRALHYPILYLNFRDQLINHINEEGIAAPEKEEHVPFELGIKRGKIYVPKYDEEEIEAMKRQENLEEATK